jgi:2-polyprenyl-3-methyl-5-hydroxy-6-metoxy-1,4-benzoquinol methylase
MITIKTDHPVAYDSIDQLCPNGIYLDNRVNLKYVQDVEQYHQNRKINYLDIGCAGGELVCVLNKRGHLAVGLDGSDHCLNIDTKMVQKFNQYPSGHENWKQFGNIHLFTCDVRYDYQIYQDENLLQFDVISAWDVMEHFEPTALDTVLKGIHRHLKPEGVFFASIHTFYYTYNEIEYHKSVFDETVWTNILSKYFTKIPYPFHSWNRDENDPLLGINNNFMYAGKREV